MNYSDMLYEMQAEYGRATNDKGLTIYQAFAFVYEEMEVYLRAKNDKAQIAAFTALLAVAVRAGIKFVKEDRFTQDVFDELGVAYTKLSSIEFDEHDKQMLEDIGLVKAYTGI